MKKQPTLRKLPTYKRVIQCHVGVMEIREGGVAIPVMFDDLTPQDKKDVVIESILHTIRLAENFGLSTDELIIEHNKQVKVRKLEALIEKKTLERGKQEIQETHAKVTKKLAKKV